MEAAIKRLISRLKRWVCKWAFDWDEYWIDNIPDYHRSLKTEDGKVVKDAVYYGQIVDVSNSAAFMHELATLQERYEREACDAFSRNEIETGRILYATSKGIKAVNKIIMKARNK